MNTWTTERRTNRHTETYMYVAVCTHNHMCMQTCIQTDTHACTHTHARTHTISHHCTPATYRRPHCLDWSNTHHLRVDPAMRPAHHSGQGLTKRHGGTSTPVDLRPRHHDDRRGAIIDTAGITGGHCSTAVRHEAWPQSRQARRSGAMSRELINGHRGYASCQANAAKCRQTHASNNKKKDILR